MLRLAKVKLVLTGLVLTAAAVLGLLSQGDQAQARESTLASQSATVRLAALPQPSEQIYALIHQGGPFASEKDGTVFGNRERLLPLQKRGYYREYTVPTPGLHHRGARRIVCGGQPRRPEVCYYTADHYASFRQIVP